MKEWGRLGLEEEPVKYLDLCHLRSSLNSELTSMPTLSKLYTMQEASQHNTKDDCWVVIDGKVYNVTSYLDEHPGGDDVVLVATGKDATDEFEDAGHSQDARELMEKFCIGELDTSPTVSSKDYSQKVLQVTKQYWAVPVTVLGISVVVGYLYLRKK